MRERDLELVRVDIIHEDDLYIDEWRKQLLSLVVIIALSSTIWLGLWWVLSAIYTAFSF